ncbi:hypothetical protein ACN9MZ_27725 [Pseudoduganella sp. S-14]|uniref:hypothetical protein n=1 Tax=Pseudoduganella sp. S-14 TaxID=3404065 RepID=UPI003CF04436
MKRSILILLWPALALAAPQSPTSRWINSDNVRLRANDRLDSPVSAILPKATELSLSYDGGEFCQVEGEGMYGFVACKFLSKDRIERPMAGQAGIDPAQRWIGGSAVILRAEPKLDAAVVGRMGLNSVVRQLREIAGTAYCEVQVEGKLGGFTACRYLLTSPLAVKDARDPLRAFWISPSWQELENYTAVLKANRPDIRMQGPWPRDEELEKMKAHLALGINPPQPAALADWQALKRRAAEDLDLTGEAERLRRAGKSVPKAMEEIDRHASVIASNLRQAMALYAPAFDEFEASGRKRMIQLVRALEFNPVRPSLFKSEADLAPYDSTTEQAGGRFGIVYRQTVTPRPAPPNVQEDLSTPGLYDMLSRTESLVRPVQRVQLFRDGQLRAEPTYLRNTATLYRDFDEEECAGWKPGFAAGDADAKMWPHVGGRPSDSPPAGSVYAFYMLAPLPQAAAQRKEFPVKLDRQLTGFVRGTHLYYDLDHDGIPDLAIWEGEGQAPGHMELINEDHRWYRVVLVNINGAWKVLGADTFGYGCGC